MSEQQQQPCAYHGMFDSQIKRIDSRTENIPIIMSSLETLTKTIQGNGRGSLTERIAVLEVEVKKVENADLEVRIQRLEDQLKQFVDNMNKMSLEETVRDVRNLTAFYNNMKKFIVGVSVPLVVTAVIGIVGLFLNFWVFMQG